MAPKDKDPVELTSGSNNDEETKSTKTTTTKGEPVDPDDALSEEDKELKERLETCVTTVMAADDATTSVGIRLHALEMVRTELRDATASMTSVPKPLKFLRPHYESLKTYYTDSLEKGDDDVIIAQETMELRARLADVLAVLAMTMSQPDDRESLGFKLKASKDYATLKKGGKSKVEESTLGSWGHEFVRSLAGEIGQEYGDRIVKGVEPDDDEALEDLLTMVRTIVPFHITHNAEAEAVDLLIEVQRLKLLLTIDSIDENNYERICLYLVRAADYMVDPDDLMVRLHVGERSCFSLVDH